MSKVTVAVNSKNKQVFTPNDAVSKNGKELGFYIVKSSHVSMENGFIVKQTRSATLTIEQSLAKELDWKEGTQLPGKIIVQESFEPFYEGQECKINPDTKAEVKVDGKNVYRQSRYTDDVNAVDTLITAASISAVPQKELMA